ncbi:Ldh family oxidoreductase [Gudongella sp. SC589]|uniref:Ldh family oxidoreductase n=1 Tax=Gudongella sp. SC589 TaxID=3385990 RepID=UPI003904647A
MSYYRIGYEEIRGLCRESFLRTGFTREESEIITDVILLSDLYGIESHGVQRMAMYHRGIKSGMMKVENQPEVVFETPVSATIDAKSAMGQLAAHKGMELAIEKAQKSGMGMVVVRNSNHFGIAGYYAKMASDKGLLGLAFTNSGAIMVPTYGRMPMIGSNPIALAMPADPYDFLFDASTTVVTHGKLEVYKKLDKPMPEGWTIDENGEGTVEAAKVIDNIAGRKGGGILPIGGSQETSGGHKGYGYGMMAEIFSSIMSMGLTSNYCLRDGVDGCSHGFLAIDPGIFGDREEIKKHLSAYLEEIRGSEKAEGAERIYTHGEKEAEALKDRMEKGILLNGGTLEEIRDICKELDIDFKLPLKG